MHAVGPVTLASRRIQSGEQCHTGCFLVVHGPLVGVMVVLHTCTRRKMRKKELMSASIKLRMLHLFYFTGDLLKEMYVTLYKALDWKWF